MFPAAVPSYCSATPINPNLPSPPLSAKLYNESFFSVASTACWKYCCAWKISLAAFSSFGSTTNLLNNKYPKVPIAIAPTIPKSTFWLLATHSSVLEALLSNVSKNSAVVLSLTSISSTSSN
jgi:hypothetical protein